jgi:hypothetical protein
MRSHLDAMVRDIGERRKGKDYREAPALDATEAGALALVAIAEVRAALPSLEAAMTGLSAPQRAEVIAHRPDPYFAEFAASLLEEAPTFDLGSDIQRTAMLPCAVYMTTDQLRATLKAWAENSQCWGRGTIDNVVRLYHATAHLGPARNAEFREFLTLLAGLTETISVVNYQNIHNGVSRQLAGLLTPMVNTR